MKQDTYTLHKPMRRHFKQNRVIVGGIDQQWQIDLADMPSMQKFNDGYRYLLVCIDVFSKYAWVIPLKDKMGPTLVKAFKVILTSGRKPEKIMTDQGTEFLNKHFRALMKEEDIELYNTYNETKASIVERLIRTLKRKCCATLRLRRPCGTWTCYPIWFIPTITVFTGASRRNPLMLLLKTRKRCGTPCMMITRL
jgi:transposase InsO family protein